MSTIGNHGIVASSPGCARNDGAVDRVLYDNEAEYVSAKMAPPVTKMLFDTTTGGVSSPDSWATDLNQIPIANPLLD